MRRTWSVLITAGFLIVPLQAGQLRYFEDATIHAVQFVDEHEGWAVGDDGVIWHSINGGKNWERQPSGTRASLRSLHFLTPTFGYVVGRDELPMGEGSVGVILFTKDAGENWQLISINALPGLNQVRFVDYKNGYLLGDGTDQFPSGVFATKDGGNQWFPVKGPRCSTWQSADFTQADNGTLVGGWTGLARLRKGQLAKAKLDSLGGRHFRSVYLPSGVSPNRKPQPDGYGIAVGQGGLILFSKDDGESWDYLELRLPKTVRFCLDFNAVHGSGKHLWIAGRPGTILLHSSDGGKSWNVQQTGAQLPIRGLFFLDEKRGWAVGELGSILATQDGGKTWKAQRRGGRRVAMMTIHAHGTGAPLGTIALIGGEEGYETTSIRVIAPDSQTGDPKRIAEEDRLQHAVREVGGASTESLWQFSLPSQLRGGKSKDILESWTQQHGERAADLLIRNLVLAIRTWRPDVIVTDDPAGTETEALTAMAVQKAFQMASDPKAFPEQVEQLGLKPWSVSKLYAKCDQKKAQLHVALTATSTQFRTTIVDFVEPSAELLAGKSLQMPTQESYRLIESRISGADKHQAIMQGVNLAYGGEARRTVKPADDLSVKERTAIRVQNNLRAMTSGAGVQVTDPDRFLSTMGKMLDHLPMDRAARSAHAVAWHYVHLGQWSLAREAFLNMVQRFPAHPLTASAYRWLIQHNSSSETRRRHELGQFIVTKTLRIQQASVEGLDDPKDGRERVAQAKARTKANLTQTKQVSMIRDYQSLIDWHTGSLKLGERLFAFGKLYARDPGIHLALQAAHRHLGELEPGRQWFTQFVKHQPKSAWRDAAETELWLMHRGGKSPKPAITCRETKERPFLDGKLDDACWKGLEPVTLGDAVGKTAKGYVTQAQLAYDNDFVYLALRCEHPKGMQVPLVKKRTRDADLDDFDRVTLYLDLDRDYSTAYCFEVDQRGCLRESCWGDVRWNPKWFVAIQCEATFWQVEAAIPLGALTGDLITPGKIWCCNVVRTLPGRGAQAWSLPAGVTESEPRLEGMGLLRFHSDASSVVRPTGPRMQRVPR